MGDGQHRPAGLKIRAKPGSVMRLVLFENRKKTADGEKPARRALLTDEDMGHFHKPWALKAFALLNLAAAVYYGALGSYGIVTIMFFDTAIGTRVNFSDMIDLLQRSLWHNMAAGVALIADHIMQGFTQIMRKRNPQPLPPLSFESPRDKRP